MMKPITTGIYCVCVMLTLASLSWSQEWRGIVPLQSTRADVERLLGAPEKPGGTLYVLERENVVVLYSGGSCKGAWDRWGVPRDTVVELMVHFKAKPLLVDLKLEESKYIKEADPHLLGIIYYNNNEEGVSYAVDTNLGVVNSATYFPTAAQNHLRCSDSAAKTLSDAVDDGLTVSQKFDEYSDISFEEEKKRLDQFATELIERQRNESGTKGYVIAYAGQRARVGEARARADRAKGYLVNVRGLGAEGIEAIDGGHRKRATVELWIRPNGWRAPPILPTVNSKGMQVVNDDNAKAGRRCRK